MISLDSKTCPFCKSDLRVSQTEHYIQRRCLSLKCKHQYCIEILAEEQGSIAYYIEGIEFVYYFNDEHEASNMCYIKSRADAATLNKHIIATPDNYLQVIDKIKSLQVFS